MMTTQVLFVQGGGEGAHAYDAPLARNLGHELGAGYEVTYPRMPNESDPNYQAWKECIAERLGELGKDVVVVAHSVGASVLIKYLVESAADLSLSGVFLIAPPFLHETEGWPWKEAELPADAARRLPAGIPLFIYHGRDDQDVPFAHLAGYAKTFPRAVCRALNGRNHQLNEDLTEVANDVRSVRG